MIEVDESGCWLWTGWTDDWGYGAVKMGGVVRKAHRVMFEIVMGRPPADGLYICHTCDVPACVNPAHLWEGTPSDNARDREAKNRGRWAVRAVRS